VAISVSQLEKLWDVQLELPLGLEDEDFRTTEFEENRIRRRALYGSFSRFKSRTDKYAPTSWRLCLQRPGVVRFPSVHRSTRYRRQRLARQLCCEIFLIQAETPVFCEH
jgi:hypothetical protein